MTKINTREEYLEAIAKIRNLRPSAVEAFNELFDAIGAYEAQEKVVHRRPSCDCETPNIVLDAKHDAYCCLSCNRWLERQCFDEECSFCAGRPATPDKQP